MNWALIIPQRVKKQIEKLNRTDRIAVMKSINVMRDAPFIGDCKKLMGAKNHYRKRVGRHRILFGMEDDVVLIERVEKRGDNTYQRKLK